MTKTVPTGRAVSFTGVVKAFGPLRAVDGVGLEICPGETVALLGRNGAGKSTTISLLLGLDHPDTGRVELFGGPPQDAVGAGQMGAMLQEGRVVPRVTVRELVSFVAGRYPAPLPGGEALALAGIEELAGRRVDKLSWGTSVTDGGGIGFTAVAVLTAWLPAFASYAVSSYRRAARTA